VAAGGFFDLVAIGGFFGCLFLYFVALFAMTESEALPKRVRAEIPANRLRALVKAPFLPGGGRGTLFVILAQALFIFGIGTLAAFTSTTSGPRHVAEAAGVVACYVMAIIGVPAAIFGRHAVDAKGRFALRAFIFGGTVAMIFVPLLIGFATRSRDLLEFKHALNPIWSYTRVAEGRGEELQFILGCVFLVSLVVCLPRMVSGVSEVMAASRARAAKPAEPPPVA
jgi:hypothetical protein